MINRLRRKFIIISAIAVVSVILLVFFFMTAFNISSMNKTVDTLADSVSNGGGRFPDFFDKDVPPKQPPNGDFQFDFITPETRFSTRYFTVWLNSKGEVTKIDIESIAAIDEKEAIDYAKSAVNDSEPRGWISNYRYKVSSPKGDVEVVFVDGTMNKAAFVQSTMSSAIVLICCALLVMMIIILLSKRVVRPIAESYEKQKQFITDANHELKTPLTLILANVDLVEAEIGDNEWLNDIRAEGNRMTGLVNQLVALSRMDEEKQSLNISELALDNIVSDISAEFQPLAEKKGKLLSTLVSSDVSINGDEVLIRRLVSILLDNAVKYCDAGGEICISLSGGRRTVLTVENTYKDVECVALDKLFDRFYRADKARKFTGGYGIGLSIAKAVVENHRGEICAYKKDSTHIGFRVIFKN